MTLEESIRFHTEEAEKMKLHKAVNELILGTEAYERELQEHTQTAEWLKELQERRKQPEIIQCGECAHSNKEYSGEMWCGICNGFGIDENSFCSFAEKRYVENG